jgi:hypothetical protein
MASEEMASIGFNIAADLKQAYRIECIRRDVSLTDSLVAFIESVVNGDYDQMLIDQSKYFASQCRDCAGQGMPTKAALYCAHCGKPMARAAEKEAGDEQE